MAVRTRAVDIKSLGNSQHVQLKKWSVGAMPTFVSCPTPYRRLSHLFYLTSYKSSETEELDLLDTAKSLKIFEACNDMRKLNSIRIS